MKSKDKRMAAVVTKRPEEQKEAVAQFWNAASCGEDLYLPSQTIEGYKHQADERYRLEPYILELAEFDRWRGQDVLEVGVGLGADHQRFAEGGANVTGVDITPRGIEHARRRFDLLGLKSNLRVADAENLPFADDSFDMVYSYGVIHHTPKTPRAAAEILRVLKPGGHFRVMIYHTHSLVGLMLWLRYGVGRKSLKQVYADHLESPGTKAYTPAEARELFAGATRVETRVVLTHGDLLASAAGQRHRGKVLSIARVLWPRWLLRRIAKDYGLFLFVTGVK